jgi:RNA polymerase sigma-70 factor (ECF subfamily)
VTDSIFNECMARVSNGDKGALREIYEEYLSYLYSIAYSVLGSRENAEDVTSECFIKLWQTAKRYRPGNGHKGYLATIVRNMCIDLLRKQGREVYESPPDDDAPDRPPAELTSAGFEDEVVDNITLQAALDKLKPVQREIINLKIMGGHTFKEIAGILKKPMGTVTWNYNEAIKFLRRCGYE